MISKCLYPEHIACVVTHFEGSVDLKSAIYSKYSLFICKFEFTTFNLKGLQLSIHLRGKVEGKNKGGKICDNLNFVT